MQYNTNNLFQYATKELSQDAFICWIANWYNFDNHLKNLAESFISLIMRKHGVNDFSLSSVSVLRQYNHVDVLLVVNSSTAIIIEDKTFTTEHGNQLSRYANALLNSTITDNKTSHQIQDVICVYFKTGEYIRADEMVYDDNDVVKLTRGDMLSLLQPYVNESEIVYDYYENLKVLDSMYNELENKYLCYNYDEPLKYSHMQWKFFKDYFQESICDKTAISRHKSLPDNQDVIEQGSSFGNSYTWYWFLEFSNDEAISPEDLIQLGRFLGYRIDSNSKGSFISLRMYWRYDKKNQYSKGKQEKTFERLRNFTLKFIDNESPKKYKTKFNIIYNNAPSCTNYECEIFKCYFKENVFDDQTCTDFVGLLKDLKKALQNYCNPSNIYY